MKLKDKLNLLGSSQSPGAPETVGCNRPASATLEGLRQKMAEILQKQPPIARPAPDPSLSDLGFTRTETEEGPLLSKTTWLRPSHHVGRMPVSAALESSGPMLALLSLEPSLATIDFRQALYLDIETTGLRAGAGVLAFLLGLGWFDEDGRLVLEQLLLRQPSEEWPMLRRLGERVAHASVLVTFNGKSFDWPLLKGRLVMNRLTPLSERPHLDLLHVARRLHRARLGACRLAALESDVLGWVRGEDIEGAEVPGRYTHYLRTGDQECLRAVIEHNGWDVVSMAALLGLYGEPLGALHCQDLVALASTLKRAGALEQAWAAAQVALERGARASGLRIRGQIAKARGDRAQALADFAASSEEVNDAVVRLELSKLYEHYVKEPLKALELALEGTGERPEAYVRRVARLLRKTGRSQGT